jgi:AraC-like DNA-binding protein
MSMVNLAGRIAGYLRECFERQSPPGVEELAARVGMHPVTLRRRVKQLYGMTVCRYLKEQQVRFACELLHGGDSLGDIALQAGFRNERSFFRSFRREQGQTPRRYASSKVSVDESGPRMNIEETP